jgi:hypothetical protein
MLKHTNLRTHAYTSFRVYLNLLNVVRKHYDEHADMMSIMMYPEEFLVPSIWAHEGEEICWLRERLFYYSIRGVELCTQLIDQVAKEMDLEDRGAAASMKTLEGEFQKYKGMVAKSSCVRCRR